MAQPAQQIMGLASGFDTAGIIESLMSIERKSVTKLEEKISLAELKLQAYRSVNTLFTAFKDSINALADIGTWSQRKATSSNESLLTATADKYALPGTHTFRVAQLASSAQYMSKGFSSATSKVSPNQEGVIRIDSVKSRVDTTAKLETLNSGNGVYRGSIRIMDGEGQSTIVDLSACMTVKDAIDTINSSGAFVNARINDDGNGITIEDKNGSSSLRVQNYGTGTTASDLGIAGSADSNGILNGKSVYQLSDATRISDLRDGLGLDLGVMRMGVMTSGDATGASALSFNVDFRGCNNAEDIVNAFNNAVAAAREANPDKADIANLAMEIDAESGAFKITGMKGDQTYFTEAVNFKTDSNGRETTEIDTATVSRKTFLTELGLKLDYQYGLTEQKGAKVFGQIDSPMLKNVAGVNGTGIGAANGSGVTSGNGNGTSGMQILDLTGATSIADLLENGRLNQFANKFSVTYDNGSGAPVTKNFDFSADADFQALFADGSGKTLDDLLAFVNGKLSDEGLGDLSFSIKDNKAIQLEKADPMASVAMSGLFTSQFGLASSTNVTGYPPAYVEINAAAGDTLSAIADDLGITFDGDGKISNTLWFNVNGTEHQVDFENSGLDSSSTLGDLVDFINGELKSSITAETGESSTPIEVALSGNRLVLSGLAADTDVSKLSISGTMAQKLGINLNGYDASTANTPSVAGMDIRLTQSGYYDKPALDADTNTMADLAVDFSDPANQTLEFSITDANGANPVSHSIDLTKDVDGNTVDLSAMTVKEFEDHVAALVKKEVSDAAAFKLGFGTASDGKLRVNIAGLGVADGHTGSSTYGITFSGTLADNLGIDGELAKGSTINPNTPPASFDAVDLYPRTFTARDQEGLGVFEFTYKDSGGNVKTVTLSTDGLDQDSTLNDLVRKLNAQLKDPAVTGGEDFSGLSFRINDNGNGIALDNSSGKAVTVVDHPQDTLASDLGFAGKTIGNNTYSNGGNLDRRYIDRSSLLSELNGGSGVPAGKIRMYAADGRSTDVDLSACKTIGDVIDTLNDYGGGVVTFRVNDTGDGIIAQQAGADTTTSHGETKDITGNIRFEELSGGSTAKALGLLGEGDGGADGYSVLNARFEKIIKVGKDDTLQDIMFRIDESGAPVTASVINDGDPNNPHRLVVSADSSGAKGDFVLDTDIAAFSMRKSAAGQDSILLYGSAGAQGGPTALTSSTNTNNSSILGVNLELKQASSEYITINVTQDKAALADQVSAMVEAYNQVKELVNYLDNYKSEEEGMEGEPSILFGDTNLRRLMDQMSDIFFGVYYKDGTLDTTGGTKATSEQLASAKSWYDLGVTFASDGTLELDLDTLNNMINNDYDTVVGFMCATRSVSQTSMGGSATFNGAAEEGYGVNNAIDGNNLGSSKGFKAKDTIASGANEYTVMFSGTRTLSQVILYHPNSAEEPAAQYSLKDFVVEYMDEKGAWQTLRSYTNNKQSGSYPTFEVPTACRGVRVRATSTNAPDDQFRLLEIECIEEEGLAGRANRTVNALGDKYTGFWASWESEVNEQIADLEAAIERQNEILDKKETRLYNQFTAMETALSQLQGQSDYFSAMVDSMNSSKKK